MITKKWRECQNNIQSPDGEKSAIKPNEQKGACSHFAMAKRIIEENLTIRPNPSNPKLLIYKPKKF
jgi:hypothetical protein